MDHEQFDAIARLVWTRQSRRAALAAAFGAALLGSSSLLATAKPKPKDKRQRRRKRKQGNAGDRRPCYPGTNCQAGPGRDNAGCDFANATQFFEGDFSGSDLSGANLAYAQMAGAKLQGVDLSGACLVGANLLEADLDGADLGGAVFCQTLMPDGSLNDSGCGGGTRCCPTPEPTCPGGVCGPDIPCTNNPDGICGLLLPPCCFGRVCTPSAGIVILNCEVPCNSDQDCENAVGLSSTCRVAPGVCPFLPGARCCSPISDD